MLKLTTANTIFRRAVASGAIDYRTAAAISAYGARFIDFGVRDPCRPQGLRRGGIMPDIRTDPEYISRFRGDALCIGLHRGFRRRIYAPPSRSTGRFAELHHFDADYADFAEFMRDKRCLTNRIRGGRSKRCAKRLNDRFGEVTGTTGAHRSRPERRHADQLET